MKTPKRCVDCGISTTNGRRCKFCERGHQQRRNALPRRQAYADPAYRVVPLGGLCYLCGKPGADTRDHVIPLSRGGSNDPTNLRPSHRSCNSEKGAKP